MQTYMLGDEFYNDDKGTPEHLRQVSRFEIDNQDDTDQLGQKLAEYHPLISISEKAASSLDSTSAAHTSALPEFDETSELEDNEDRFVQILKHYKQLKEIIFSSNRSSEDKC
jgi:hypothetical protein